ncbi:MAG TPA: hypothetical protein VNA12_05095 [Mycobacteriales bacterium]|nr:hypothetical protein [Mycobacteriales bacterium]
MISLRLIPCAATALALLSGGVAGAASSSSVAKGCTVIIDPSGDATDASMGPVAPPPGAPAPPNDDYLDLLSAGLASDGEFVTTTLRMKAMGLDVTSPHRSFWTVYFQVGAQKLSLHASTSPVGLWNYWWFNEATGDNGDATGTVDTARNEIRMTAPAEALSPLLRRGAKLTAINVRTGRFLPIGLGAFMTVDSAATEKPHVVGSRSCLKPVR